MKKYYKYKTYFVFSGILLMMMPIWSCKKFVTVPLPAGQVTAAAIFSDSTGLTAGLSGVYEGLAGISQDAFNYPSLFADDLVSPSSYYDPAQKNQYTPSTDYGFFTAYYQVIYRANAILAGVDNATNIAAAVRTRTKGESLFLRAYAYFQLVNFYGAVPLYTGIDIQKNALLPNSPTADVYKQIIADLIAAAPLLNDKYSEEPRIRVNKETVYALLARAYLYTNDYNNAIAAAKNVITSGLYSLDDDLNNVSASTSTETIFQLWYQVGYTLGSQYIPDPGYDPYFLVRPELVNSFEPGDKRKTAWLQLDGEQYYPSKWKNSYDTPNAQPEYLVLFRLAEMYLIRAEARANTNDVSGGVEDINVIRHRAGLDPITTITATDSGRLLDTVASERRKELCFESGHRWFDLNRNKQTVSVLTPLKPGFDAHLTILPIPLSQIKNNPNLKQNSNY